MSDMEMRVLLALGILLGAWVAIKLIQAFYNAWGGKDLW